MAEMTKQENANQETADYVMNCISGAVTGGGIGFLVPAASPVTGPLGAAAGCFIGLGVTKASHAVGMSNPYIQNCISGGTTGLLTGSALPFVSPFTGPAGGLGGCFVGLGIATLNDGVDKANEPYKPQQDLPSKRQSDQLNK